MLHLPPRVVAATVSLVLVQALCAQAAGPATVRVKGRVVQWDGSPVVGAAVGCVDDGTFDTAKLLQAPTATTDADGRFELTAVPPTRPASTAPGVHIAAKGMAAVLHTIEWRTRHDGAFVGGPWASPDMLAKLEFEPETDVGEIVLIDGKQLVGRVRDQEGKPLAGARVVAADLLEARNNNGVALGATCAATSDASGIFKLPCALPNAAILQVSLGGYYREWRQPVSAATPLEVTLRPSGWIQGRVLGKEGHSVADAWITVNYELRAAPRLVRCEADGSFRVSLESPGRWRIHANSIGENAWHTDTPVHTGPAENLEILIEPKAAETKQTIPVTAVAKKDGTALTDFVAIAIWDQYAQQDANYREYRLRMEQHGAQKPKDGLANVRTPDANDGTVGVLRVQAKGFAPFTKTDLEWKEPAAGESVDPIRVELEPEATVRGVVRDEQTGAPLAGAEIAAEPVYERAGWYTDDRHLDYVKAADDGTFELRGLGEGSWRIEARHPKRPAPKPIEFALGAGEHKDGVDVGVAAGATVKGRVTGLQTTHGVRVVLGHIPTSNDGQYDFYFDDGSGSEPGSNLATTLAADGSFALEGVGLESYMLLVRLPGHPRLGSDVRLPIEPFRVRKNGIDRVFDATEDQPGSVGGRITFTRAGLPFEQLLVVAMVQSEHNGMYYSPFDMSQAGPRAFVDREGAFTLPLGAGDYKLLVVDLATGATIHFDEKKFTVATGKPVARDLALDLVKFAVELAPAQGITAAAALDRLEVRFVPKALKDMAEQWGGNEEYDNDQGIWLQPGQTSLHLTLPEGNVTLLARANTARLRTDDNRWQNPPVGRCEFEVSGAPNAPTSCKVEVGAPAEIPGTENETGGEGKAEAAGQVEVLVRDVIGR